MAETPPDQIFFEVANNFAALEQCSVNVSSFLAAWGLCRDDIADVLVVLDELASNVIRYAWPEGDKHSFSLSVGAKRADRVVELAITLDDDGVAFDPAEARPEPPPLLCDQLAVGGFGLELVAALSDDITYRRSGGRNRLTIRKRVTGCGRTPC
jgi:serine/threonine-protein kinase RsbW